MVCLTEQYVFAQLILIMLEVIIRQYHVLLNTDLIWPFPWSSLLKFPAQNTGNTGRSNTENFCHVCAFKDHETKDSLWLVSNVEMRSN